jgi:hypothetical protein
MFVAFVSDCFRSLSIIPIVSDRDLCCIVQKKNLLDPIVSHDFSVFVFVVFTIEESLSRARLLGRSVLVVILDQAYKSKAYSMSSPIRTKKKETRDRYLKESNKSTFCVVQPDPIGLKKEKRKRAAAAARQAFDRSASPQRRERLG